MKCGARIYYYKKTYPSGLKKVAMNFSVKGMSEDEILHIEKEVARENVDSNYDICDGDILGKISAEEELYMGGVSAILDVSYSCTKCKCVNYRHLPNEHNINAWFNNWLNNYES